MNVARRAWMLAALLTAAAAPPAPVGASPAPAADSTHREVLTTDDARVQRLVLGPGASTGQHTHAHPHIAVALTGGELADVAPDGSTRPRKMAEGALAFVPAGVAHALRNAGSATFRAVTVDLLRPQTGARNRCGALLPGQPLNCPDPASRKMGALLVPQMATDQTVVSLLTLDPGADYRFQDTAMPPVVVALEGTEAKALVELNIAGAVGKGEKPMAGGDAVSTEPRSALGLHNTGRTPARFLVLEFK
jgi:quercetin dioxygenase-like cupin family protein